MDWQRAQPMDWLGKRMSGRPTEQKSERQRLDLPLELTGQSADWKWGQPLDPLDPPLEQS